MSDAATVKAFIEKWEQNAQKESAASKEHFVDLCRLLGQKTPNDPGSGPEIYCFEKSLTKVGGSAGFADVWRRDRFAWEYKTKGKYPDLRAAYQQLLLYKEDLDNPPILVACDIANYEVHIAFTGFKTRVERFTNADLANASTRELLRLVMTDPEQLRPTDRVETVTEIAAARFARVATFLEKRGYAPTQVAPFFVKILFAFFAEDIRLLPRDLMTASIKQAIFKPQEFPDLVRALFRTMRDGGYFGPGERVPRFNGGLFDNDEVIPLNADELTFLAEAAKLDWSQVEPAIFGTLFERSLDPSKRSQLGAHYTSRDDILLIVEPVLMAPYRRDWHEVKTGVEALREQWEAASGAARQRLRSIAEGMLFDFMDRLSKVRVLDPACGSGNFLYVALNQLKDLEKEVLVYAIGIGLTAPELGVTPAQFYGIEKNLFAAELAQVVIWIGYLQWKRINGFWDYDEPILKSLYTIECRDAILGVDQQGQPIEPEWPEADVIVGNPPFLGGYRMRRELGDQYAKSLFELYAGHVPATADLVCYWFERARKYLEMQQVGRVGLLATNSIRGGANRRVLDHIKEGGNIFLAWSDRAWVLEGADVRVSMVGFDAGHERERFLDGRPVQTINSDLTEAVDLISVQQLTENEGISFKGVDKTGPFEIPVAIGNEFIMADDNLPGWSNSNVVKLWANGFDITHRPRNMWIIDFGVDMPFEEASQYKRPFAYVEQYVKPTRTKNREQRSQTKWWQFGRPRPAMRTAIAKCSRFIATTRHAKYRLFVWMPPEVLPDSALVVFAREDDYFFGILHSKAHELWSLRLGSWLGVGNDPRYTATSTFETFPFPWPPGKEPKDDPRVEAIADAARDLVRQRDEWLNPTEVMGVSLKDRTLTNLYNKRPDWLDQAHRRLDEAVFAAYGWPADLSDEEILSRLLALNLERAAGQGVVVEVKSDDAGDREEE